MILDKPYRMFQQATGLVVNINKGMCVIENQLHMFSMDFNLHYQNIF